MGPEKTRPATVGVVGGGLAGLAAGCALAEAGFQVTLFERRPYLGGRASSYQHPGTGEVVDNCQHVLLGCCTNLIDLYRRTGTEDKIRWYDRLTFLQPGGRASSIHSSFLPAPFHAVPAFLRADHLNFKDKLSIARALFPLLRRLPPERGESFSQWLQKYHPTPAAVEHFWKPILISALNEDLERASVPYAAQVMRESFLKSAEAGRMGVPAVPLSDLYGAAGNYITARGGEVLLRAVVDAVDVTPEQVRVQAGGREVPLDFLVLAAPFDVTAKLLPESAGVAELRAMLQRFETSPIAGIHFWFDRKVTSLDHAVLLDRTIQWMFHKSHLQQRTENGGSYVELVVSAARSLVEKAKNEIVEMALAEFCEFFPEARSAVLVKSTVIKEVHATFSPAPGADAYRPGQITSWPRVFLAGDWTATGWPATMEGAVRSGYLAAEAVAQATGKKATRFVVADLPARGLMRWFG
jgi:squalene-associated FAD-dependent desaturase